MNKSQLLMCFMSKSPDGGQACLIPSWLHRRGAADAHCLTGNSAALSACCSMLIDSE